MSLQKTTARFGVQQKIKLDFFLQLYFQSLTYVCSIITTPTTRGSLITSYNLSSSTDGEVWEEYTSVIEVDQSDWQTYLPKPLAARYLRIHPIKWTHWPCFQLAVTAQHVEIVRLHIVAEGWSDPGVSKRKPLCSIKVNNIEQCPGHLGHNVVVLDPSTGNVLDSSHFDTAKNDTAAQELATYLKNIKRRMIIIIAVAGSGYRNIDANAGWQLYSIGASDPLVSCENCSWILVGRQWAGKPWVTQKYRSFSQGPSHLTLDIPLEENNEAAHFWRLDQIVNNKIIEEKSQLHFNRHGAGIYGDTFLMRTNSYGLTGDIGDNSCLVNPDKCPGGLSIAFWNHPYPKSILPQRMPNHPMFKVQENGKAKCYHSWLTRNNNKCCIFPFTFKNKVYTTCTGDESEPGLWCSVSPTFEQDGKKGYCAGCNRPLVMNKLMLTSSSKIPLHHEHYARFWWNSCWSPSSSDARPYLQINLAEILYITAIATKGGVVDGQNHWVRSYRLWYTFRLEWRLYFENHLEKDFVANNGTEVRHVLKEVIKVRSVRIYPQVHTGKIALKVQLYGCNEDEHPLGDLDLRSPPPKDCGAPLGLQDGQITNSQLYASTFESGFGAHRGRLHASTFWRASVQDKNQFFMVVFEDRVYITALATQGGKDNSGAEYHVTSFYLTMSINRLEWIEYFENEQLKIFQRNKDANTAVKNYLRHPVLLRYIKIHPKTWKTNIGLRAEFYGCYKDNPKFSIVGPVYHKYEGGKLPLKRLQFVTVAFKICYSTLPCPTCKRQVYVRMRRHMSACVATNSSANDCEFVELNVTLSYIIYDFKYHRYTFPVEVFDAFGPKCHPTPFVPVPSTSSVVGYLTTEYGQYGSCLSHLYNGFVDNGQYILSRDSGRRMVYCDQTTMGGGWMVIQKRFDGSINFDRDWDSYLHGFGSLDGEHWLGLQTIKEFDSETTYKDELRIDVEDFNGNVGYAYYRYFKINFQDYSLKVSNYTGSIGNSLALHNAAPFSTRDKDTASSCSKRSSNGWWNNDSLATCHTANLNGRYDSMTWKTWNQGKPLKAVRMMMRPANAIKCNDWACYYIRDNPEIRYAHGRCSPFGGRLLSITSADEMSFIKTIMEEQSVVPEAVCLGLQFDSKNKVFSWRDGSALAYNQATIQSLNTSTGCFALIRKANDYVWDQYPCSKKRAKVVCKRGKTCHNNVCYGDFTNRMQDCSTNEKLCQTNNLRMTRIIDRKTDEFITKHIKDNARTGLQIDSDDNKFVWSGFKELSYTNWKGSERAPIQGHCVSQTKTGWVMEESTKLRPSLCEHDAKIIYHCKDLFKYGVSESGLYAISGSSVYCDMENDGGGWEVIMRRSNDGVTFEQENWASYEAGFGSRTSKTSSFWHGNKLIYGLTFKRHKSLLINIVLANNTKYYAFYDNFDVLHSGHRYMLQVSGYSGNAGDALSDHNGAKFSTPDKDFDKNDTVHCAKVFGGGWWFKSDCLVSNLNGKYSTSTGDRHHIYWETLHAPIKYVEMKIKTFSSVTYPSFNFLRTMHNDDQKGFRIQYNGISHLVTVRSSTKKWQLSFPAPSHIWYHVMITWSEATGILYYANGLLKAASVSFEVVKNTASGTNLRLGGAGDGRIESYIFRLGVWNRQLEQHAVENVYRFNNYSFEVGRIRWPNKPYNKASKNHHLNWKRNSGCTPSVGTGPCTDHSFKNPRGSYLYAEASAPGVKGNYSIIQSPLIPGVYRCIRFWFHMQGTGNADLTLKDSKTNVWKVLQNNKRGWQHGQASTRTLNAFSQRIYFISSINENFESDIAIDDISYDVRSCTSVSLHSLNDQLSYEAIGCYKEPGWFIGNLEEMLSLSDSTPYEQRTNAIQKCAQAAKARGYSVFGLKKGGYCRGGYEGHLHYQRAGIATDCPANGKGSSTSLNIYKFDVCDPKCPKGIPCNVKTRTCECPDMKYIDEECKTTLYKTIFIDASHYWSFDDVLQITDLVRYKSAVIEGKISIAKKGASNKAIQLNGTSNSIVLGDFASECIGNFELCANGLTISVWIKHYWNIKDNTKHVFLSLGSTSGLEKGFQIGYDPTIQGEPPYVSLLLTFTTKSCKFKFPVLGRELWNHYGFSFKNLSVLSVYHNGQLVESTMKEACTTVTTIEPKNHKLRVGLTTQNSVFEIDDLVVWYKWLNETDYLDRYKVIGGGKEQKVNFILKLSDSEWHDSLKNLESHNATVLMKIVSDNFKVILKDAGSKQPVIVDINGFSKGSVNVNVTLKFGSLTYNDSLILEKWLFEKEMLNNISVKVLGMTSSTVPQLYPNMTSSPYNLSAIQLDWDSLDNEYDLFQGYKIIYRETEKPESAFQVHTVYGETKTILITNLEPGVNYTIRMLIISLAGDGFISPIIYGITKDDFPNGIPIITSYVNTSSSSLLVNWTHIAKENWRGVPLGYRIVYWPPEIPTETVQNTTVLPELAFIELTGLRKFANYCLKTAAYNKAGDGNFTQTVCLKTDEDVPDRPPANVEIRNVTNMMLKVTSTGVPLHNRNGIILKYTVNWTAYDGSSHGVETCVNSTLITCYIKGLTIYTRYNISMTSFTRLGAGNYSAWYTVLTDESVPSLPPPDLKGFNTSSTSLVLSWSTIPQDHHNGRLGGFVIKYSIKNTYKWQYIWICKSTLSTNLTLLKPYREYNISVAGFTAVGIGPVSNVYIWTDEDIPFSPPVNFSGTNLTSTSLRLQWKAVPYEHANGLILGYTIQLLKTHIIYKNILNTSSYNITVLGESSLHRVFTLLEMFTDYTYRILAFTSKGNGNFTEVITVRTNEDTPFIQPLNFTVESLIWHTSRANWTLIPPVKIPGICRGYILHYLRKEGTKDVGKSIQVSANTTSVLIPNLAGYILYDFWIYAFTYPHLIGPHSNVSIRTLDWLPLIPPRKFTAIPVSSTSIKVSWEKLPEELTNGVMVGYILEYTNNNKTKSMNATYSADTTSATLTNLWKFNYFTFKIIPRNVNGFCRYWSNSTTVRTFEDTPDKSPANSTGQSVSPTSVLINWKPVPRDYQNGYITKHSVFYRLIAIAEEPVLGQPTIRKDVGPTTYELLIQDLQSFADYDVMVLARTVKGDGVKAAAFVTSTCRCYEHVTTNWRIMPPYVTHNEIGLVNKPIGMMPAIIEAGVLDCCRDCPAFGKVKINFFRDGNNNPAEKEKDIEVKSAIDDETDLSFPIFGYTDQTHYAKYYGYTPIVPSSGVAFIVNRQQSVASPNNVALAVFNCWPLLMLNVILAFAVGVIVWLLDSKYNPDHFHGSFIRGVGSGFWFAFVTLTTVGYGDKTVVTIPARIFTVFWTLFGLVVFGILMGSFSAAFETMVYAETKSDIMTALYGTKVAAIDNSSEHRLGLRKNAKVNTVHHYKTVEEIRDALVNEEVKGALVDAYEAAYHHSLFEHRLLRLTSVYHIPTANGLVLAGKIKKIEKCMLEYMSANRGWISHHIAKNAQTLKQSKAPMVEVAQDMVDSTSNIFLQSQTSLIAIFAIVAVFGLLSEAFRRFRKPKKKEDVYSEKIDTDELRRTSNKMLLTLKKRINIHKHKLEKLMKKQ